MFYWIFLNLVSGLFLPLAKRPTCLEFNPAPKARCVRRASELPSESPVRLTPEVSRGSPGARCVRFVGWRVWGDAAVDRTYDEVPWRVHSTRSGFSCDSSGLLDAPACAVLGTGTPGSASAAASNSHADSQPVRVCPHLPVTSRSRGRDGVQGLSSFRSKCVAGICPNPCPPHVAERRRA